MLDATVEDMSRRRIDQAKSPRRKSLRKFREPPGAEGKIVDMF